MHTFFLGEDPEGLETLNASFLSDAPPASAIEMTVCTSNKVENRAVFIATIFVANTTSFVFNATVPVFPLSCPTAIKFPANRSRAGMSLHDPPR